VVKALSKEIAGMQKKGYSFEQISNALKESGLDIATPTLKSYLQRSKQGTAKRKVQPKTDTAPSAENTENADTESQS
jgi:intein-encoded DNA endonuclease-like protein